MQTNLIATAALIVINFLLFYNYKFFAKELNLYDEPDKNRKLHQSKIPLLGGFFLVLNFCFISIFFYFSDYDENIFNYDFILNKDILIFIFLVFLFFLIGFIDDKINLLPFQKIISLIVISYFILSCNDLFLISTLRFKTFEKGIDLNQFSHFFTIFAIILYVNAMNMFDGINLQSCSYYLIFFTIISFVNFSILNLSILIFLIFYLFYNYKGNIFLGDSGVYFLSLFVCLNLSFIYNTKSLYIEDLIVFALIPLIDLVRLFFLRIKNNKSPFLGDRKHIHHAIIAKYSFFQTILILNLLILAPIFIWFVLNLNFILLLMIFLIVIYFLIK